MKRNEDKDFDQQLRDKFNDFTPEVSANLWGKIEEQLTTAERPKVVPITNKQRKLPTWWMAVAATLLVACGVAYWYNRPVEVIYLYGKAELQEEELTVPTVMDIPEEIPEVVLEPIDKERLKRLFAKKSPRVSPTIPVQTEEEVTKDDVAVEPMQWAATDEIQTEKPLAEQQVEAIAPIDPAAILEEALAKVPDVQPLVVLEDEEETMLASAGSKQSFGLSNILNYVVGTVDQREEKLVTFSNDSEGSLKLDFNFGLAKNRKKKIK